jgi:hypothetical protein
MALAQAPAKATLFNEILRCLTWMKANVGAPSSVRSQLAFALFRNVTEDWEVAQTPLGQQLLTLSDVYDKDVSAGNQSRR